MHTFVAVLKDLWEFLFKGSLIVTSPAQVTEGQMLAVPAPIAVPSLPAVVTKLALVAPAPAVGLQGEKAYVAVPSAQLLLRPVVSFDGAVHTLSYTDSVYVIGYEGRFAHVSYGVITGWIFKDALAQQAHDIFPVFNNGEIYSVNHPDTKKLRGITHDEFLAGELCTSLQSVEFVSYRLKEAGRKIEWPGVRPRLAGTWQNLLKGKLGIQIGVRPKTGAILEYTKLDGTGFVGYTKAVHIDEAIVIEGVGRLIEGEYREELVSKEEWHEWRPVWIQVS